MRFTRPLRLIPAFLAALLVAVLAPTVAASAAVPVCADLQVVSFTVSPQTPIAGQQATVHVTVKNNGTCSAFGATLQWKQTPTAPSGPSTNTGTITAGQTLTFDLPYTFLKAGNFESIAQIDTKNVVPETNEANNILILPVTVLAAGIDLSIKSITTTPGAPVASGYPNDPVQGRSETTAITVHNGGNTAAGLFQLKWVPKPFALAVTKQINGLGANSDVTVNLPYTYQQAGTFNSTATADATNLVKETDETNNSKSLTVTVDPQEADLTILSAPVSVGVPGTQSSVLVTVQNIGNTPAPASILSWTPGPGLGPVTQQIAGLAVNEVQQYTLPYVFKDPGSFTGSVTVDSTNVVTELNENNNSVPTTEDVSANTVDLEVLSATISPAPEQGKASTVDIKIRNNGNTTSPQFLVDWNPDANYVNSPSLQTVTYEVGPIGPGATTDVTFPFTYPSYGNFSTLTTVDPRNTVQETNEANNQLIVPVTVAPGDVNLKITSFSVNPSTIKRFSSATASVTVKNTGTFPVGSFAVQWFSVQSGGPQTKTVSGGLSPGQSITLTYTGFFFQAAGPYTSKAVVDPSNQVPETNEGDNTATTPVTITPLKSS